MDDTMDDTIPPKAITHGVEAVVLETEPQKLSDFPPEILEKIMCQLSCGAEEDDDFDPLVNVSRTSTKDIKNARLSCRNLSAAASRYLIERVRVDVSQSSLSRLEKICEDTLFHKHVQAVEICLAQYDDIFDDGVVGFTRFIRHHLPHLGIPWLRSPELARKLNDITESWEAYLRVLDERAETLVGTFDEEFESIQDLKNVRDKGYNGALLEGYCLYRSRLHEQTALQQGDFVARVSASLARLPRAGHLRITDWDTIAWGRHLGRFDIHLYRLDVSSDESIIESLVDTRRPFENVEGTSLLSMIPDLICAGKNIKSLGIQISPDVSSYQQLTLSTMQEANLRSGLKKLEFFKFDNYRSSRASNIWNQTLAVQPLRQFLDACLVSDDLQSLLINAKFRHPRPSGSFFTARPWPQLKFVELKALPVSAADLDVLTASLESHHPEGSLILTFVHLYCGATWASILDTLRDRQIRTSIGQYQRGAEFETDPGLCEEVFCENGRLRAGVLASFAEYYVHGEDMANPLTEPPDRALRHRIFGPGPNDGNLM